MEGKKARWEAQQKGLSTMFERLKPLQRLSGLRSGLTAFSIEAGVSRALRAVELEAQDLNQYRWLCDMAMKEASDGVNKTIEEREMVAAELLEAYTLALPTVTKLESLIYCL